MTRISGSHLGSHVHRQGGDSAKEEWGFDNPKSGPTPPSGFRFAQASNMFSGAHSVFIFLKEAFSLVYTYSPKPCACLCSFAPRIWPPLEYPPPRW